jgi:hypothetical protein
MIAAAVNDFVNDAIGIGVSGVTGRASNVERLPVAGGVQDPVVAHDCDDCAWYTPCAADSQS